MASIDSTNLITDADTVDGDMVVKVGMTFKNYSPITYTMGTRLEEYSFNVINSGSGDVTDIILSPHMQKHITSTFPITDTGIITGTIGLTISEPRDAEQLGNSHLYFDATKYPSSNIELNRIEQDVENSELRITLDISCSKIGVFEDKISFLRLLTYDRVELESGKIIYDYYLTKKIPVTTTEQTSVLNFDWAGVTYDRIRGNFKVYDPSGNLLFYERIVDTNTTDHNDTFQQARENGPIDDIHEGTITSRDSDTFLLLRESHNLKVTNLHTNTKSALYVRYGSPEEMMKVSHTYILDPNETKTLFLNPSDDERFLKLSSSYYGNSPLLPYQIVVGDNNNVYLPLIHK